MSKRFLELTSDPFFKAFLLRDHMNISDIARYTKLSIEKIQKLVNKE